MMALDVALNKVYGANLPQGLQHESAQVGKDKFPMEKDETILDCMVLFTFLYTIIVIYLVIILNSTQ